MAKFIKRIGTKAFKFATELHIEKVQMDVPIASRIMVAFKRGRLQFPPANPIFNFIKVLIR